MVKGCKQFIHYRGITIKSSRCGCCLNYHDEKRKCKLGIELCSGCGNRPISEESGKYGLCGYCWGALNRSINSDLDKAFGRKREEKW